jgi:hypothetical protein
MFAKLAEGTVLRGEEEGLPMALAREGSSGRPPPPLA